MCGSVLLMTVTQASSLLVHFILTTANPARRINHCVEGHAGGATFSPNEKWERHDGNVDDTRYSSQHALSMDFTVLPAHRRVYQRTE